MGEVTVARPEVLAFLDDIKLHPSDRTPRLILSDWLEERDDPRGSLLRLQWELRSLDLQPSRRLELGEIEQRLIRDHHLTWLGPLQSRVISWAFQRGLVQLQSTPDRLVRDRSHDLLDSESLAWVETIRLYGDTATPADYAATRSLQGACVLECSWTRMRGAELAGLSEAMTFPYLTELILNTCNIGAAGLGALTASRSFPALVELRLCGCGLDDPALAMLMRGPIVSQLHLLDLRNNRFTRQTIELLARPPRPTQLRELNLMHNQLTDEMVPPLCESPALNRLHALDLRGNVIGPEGQQRLFERFGPRVRLR